MAIFAFGHSCCTALWNGLVILSDCLQSTFVSGAAQVSISRSDIALSVGAHSIRECPMPLGFCNRSLQWLDSFRCNVFPQGISCLCSVVMFICRVSCVACVVVSVIPC